MNRLKAVVASYVAVLVFASLVFLGAGRVRYWQGILYVALALVGTTTSHVLTPRGSTLTTERASQAQAGEDWDKRLLRLYFLASAIMFLTAGLDSGRFGWSGAPPVYVAIVGAVVMLLGQVLFAVAKRENAFFSSTVRIQTERGHQVCDQGLYRLVRHPGYLGMLLSLLAFPLVMTSWWAFIPAVLGAGILVARTALEDRFLAKNLPGYADYAGRVRWRLVPGIY